MDLGRDSSLDESCSSSIPPSRSSLASASDNEKVDEVAAPEETISRIATRQISQISQPEASSKMAAVESKMSRDPACEIDWEDGEANNPQNWPIWYKSFVIFSLSFSTLVV